MARPFKKGHDPRRNLKGRPPRKSMTAHLEEALTDDARKKVAQKIIAAAKAGDLRAAEFMFDRIDGRVPHRIDIAERVREECERAGLSEADTQAAIAYAASLAASLSA